MYGTAKTNRDLVMYLIWKYGVYTNEEIGNLFHVTYSSVSRNVSSFREGLVADNKLKKLYNKIKLQINIMTPRPHPLFLKAPQLNCFSQDRHLIIKIHRQ